MRLFIVFACSLSAGLTNAQSLWRLDSLVATWPARTAIEESRRTHRPGVVRAMDTRGLYTSLKPMAQVLPVFADSAVDRYVNLLGEPRREDLRAALGLLEEYAPLIDGELLRNGLPKELRYLPLALSCMNTMAVGREGGAGLWMLSYPVAVRYGLRIDEVIDERRDPRLSTMAAARWLKDLHARYKDWPTATMAFACGPANVTRAKERLKGETDPRLLHPQFTKGSRDALPVLMAMTYLATHAEQLGIAPIHVSPFEQADTIRSPKELRITAIAAAQGIAKDRLRALNPALCSDRVPAYHALLMPRGERNRFEAMADSVQRLQQWLADTERKASEPGEDVVAKGPDGREAIYYRVRSGDYLGRIAQRFNVKVSQLKAWNKMKSDHIDVGEELVIWVTPSQRTRFENEKEKSEEGDGPANQATVRTEAVDADAAPTVKPAPKPTTAPAAKSEDGFTWYTVRKGDSLYGIAKRYPGVDADSLMRVNGIGAGIRPGQRIKVPVKR
ncbi:MAG TPA: LysM peptidoglycan-binding domain-containing protein [Flavobacteriales bacterium]|nr:LysM peptidoglycan-binding domain-containing protein [Flavobacteriales bacterium]